MYTKSVLTRVSIHTRTKPAQLISYYITRSKSTHYNNITLARTAAPISIYVNNSILVGVEGECDIMYNKKTSQTMLLRGTYYHNTTFDLEIRTPPFNIHICPRPDPLF